MANEKVARRYATAIFELAQERNLVERIGDELRRASELLSDDADVASYFRSPVIERSAKSQLISDAFGSAFDQIALHTLLLLVEKRREALLPDIVDAYAKLALAERKLEPLTITSARPLPQDELDAMVARLSSAYGKEFDVRREVDPSLIGGVQVLLGDRRIDGSVSGRLEALASTLFSQS